MDTLAAAAAAADVPHTTLNDLSATSPPNSQQSPPVPSNNKPSQPTSPSSTDNDPSNTTDQIQPQQTEDSTKNCSMPARRRTSQGRKRTPDESPLTSEPNSKRDRKQSPHTDSESDKEKEKDRKDRQKGRPWLDTLRVAFDILHKNHPNETSFSVSQLTELIDENFQYLRHSDTKGPTWKWQVPRSCKRYLHKDCSKKGDYYFSPCPMVQNSQPNQENDQDKLNLSSDPQQTNNSNPNPSTCQNEEIIAGKRGFVEGIARVPPEWIDEAFRPVRLSNFDKAKKISFIGDPSENIVKGFKGYRTIRATSGVMEGDWFFEAHVLKHEGWGNVRIGWAMRRTDEETPVGYDGYSFSLRDKTGELFHMARGYKYAEPFTIGDVIGCRITLPSLTDEEKTQVEKAERAQLERRFVHHMQGMATDSGIDILDKACIRFYKNGKEYGIPTIFKEYRESIERQTNQEDVNSGSGNDSTDNANSTTSKDDNGKAERKKLREESKRKRTSDKREEADMKDDLVNTNDFTKNGCLSPPSDITRMMRAGVYYPAIALYYNGIVKVNFGPDFKHPLPEGSRPMCEVARERPSEILDVAEDTLKKENGNEVSANDGGSAEEEKRNETENAVVDKGDLIKQETDVVQQKDSEMET